jgi:hypothetical protein
VSDKARTTAPDEIYLQGVIGSFSDDDVTWCADLMENDDVRYLRAPASGLEPVPCPACKSADVGGAHGIVQCYKCLLKVQHETTALATLAWNARAPLIAQMMRDALTTIKPAVHVMPPRANDFMQRFEPVSLLGLWAALETLAPSSGYWKRSKESLAYDWERGDPHLAGLTLDAIQAALP